MLVVDLANIMIMANNDSASNVSSIKSRFKWLVGGLCLLVVVVWGGYRYQLRVWDETCRTAKRTQQWSVLEHTAEQWSRWVPGSAQSWLHLADAIQHQDRYVEAAEILTRVPRASPQYVPAQIARIKILFGPANLPIDGERACLELLKIDPRVATAHELLIQFYTVTMQRMKLRSQIETAIRLVREPRDAFVFYFLIDSVRFDDGAPLNRLWLDSDTNNEVLLVAEVLQRPDESSDEQKPDPGVGASPKEQAARELLKRFPQNVNLLAYLVDEAMSRGYVDRVVELLANAPAAAEADQRFWRFKGWVHFVRGEHEQAEVAYRRALALHPMDWLSMHRLTEALRLLGKPEEITRLQSLVKRSNDLRLKLRNRGSFRDVPVEVLYEIGRLAQDCDDRLIADALTQRLGSLDPPQSQVPRQR